MAAELLGGAVVGAVFGELLSAVLEFKDKAIDFKVTLSSFGSTLEAIDPLIKEIEKQNMELGRPKEELERLIREMKEGTKLVRKCSQIHRLNFPKKARYKDKLDALEGKIKNFFVIDLQAQLTRDHKETLLKVRRILSKVDKLPFNSVNDMQEFASSSSSCFLYDVFLNFRGEDTRHGFTGNLYNALCERGIHTFIDDEGIGQDITQSHIKVIQGSQIAITIFSQNYASSRLCLEELVKILECVKGNGRLVLPVFYYVYPAEVRHQKGIYGKALARHQDEHKVEEWRLALHKVANLTGFHFRGQEYEFQYIKNIVEKVSKMLNKLSPLHISNPKAAVQDVNKPLSVGIDDEKVKMQVELVEDRVDVILGPYGGNGGGIWDDGIFNGVRGFRIRHGQLIDSIIVSYDKQGGTFIEEKHGGNGGANCDVIDLKYPNEFLIEVSWYYNHFAIYSLAFKSNLRTYGPYGTKYGTKFTFSLSPNQRIVGFHGRSGRYLDSMGLHLSHGIKKQVELVEDRIDVVYGPCGGKGGRIWDDGIFSGVRGLTIRHGNLIDSIIVSYDKQGETFIAEKHGGNGGSNCDVIELEYPNEFFTEVSGHYGRFIIRSLKLKSNKRTFGPYGSENGTPFRFSPFPNERIIGLFGRSCRFLDSVGLRVSHPIN